MFPPVSHGRTCIILLFLLFFHNSFIWILFLYLVTLVLTLVIPIVSHCSALFGISVTFPVTPHSHLCTYSSTRRPKSPQLLYLGSSATSLSASARTRRRW